MWCEVQYWVRLYLISKGGGDAATESGAAFTYAAARQKQYQT
jgi:hypothetical protein